MKKIFWIFALCAFLVPQGIWAQANIEKTIKVSEEKATKKTHNTYQDDPQSKEVSSTSDIYYFSDRKLFSGFKSAFDKDCGDAYYSDYDMNSDKKVILMDKVQVGKDYDSHYVLCFQDEKPGYRYGYALEWNKSGDNFRVVKVHGEKPVNDFSSIFMSGLGALKNLNWNSISDSVAKSLNGINWNSISDSVARSLNGINWNSISDSVARSLNGINWNSISDSVARSLNGINWNSISDSVAKSLNGINWGAISDSVSRALNGIDWHHLSDSVSREISKEMKDFSKSMGNFSDDSSSKSNGYLKQIRIEPTWEDKMDALLESSSPKSTEDISKIYDLCKNHPADLSKSDRDAYASSLKDLRKKTDDQIQKKMLASSIKFLK